MAVTPVSQKGRPIGLLLVDTGGLAFDTWGFGIPVPLILDPRPEEIEYTHPGRASAIQSMDGGWIDDFGEGFTDITATGNTGWGGDTVPGEVRWQALYQLVILDFHRRRKSKANAGLPIEHIKLYWIDTLYLTVYDVYPIVCKAKKSKVRPLLFQYSLRMIGVKRYDGSTLLGMLPGAGKLITAAKQIVPPTQPGQLG